VKNQITTTALNNPSFYSAWGEAVRIAREAKHLTQAELAEQVGLSRTSIVNVEAGRQGCLLHMALDIAGVVGVPLMELLEIAVAKARDEEIARLEDRIAALKAEKPKRRSS
jgi:DNA-binding XRE family transcriptional regulator